MQADTLNTEIHSPERVLEPATYRLVLRVRGFQALLLSTLLTRIANQAWYVAQVLFVLQRYHSPTLAGLSVFLMITPGLVVSPISGALLDRYGRRRLMIVDFVVAAAAVFAIVVLSVTHRLPPALLLAILGASSLTGALSMGGQRSLFPLTVPARLWDRANALDSFTYSGAAIVGPAIAGTITSWVSPEAALITAAVGYIAAAIAMLAVAEPRVERELSGHVLRDAWEGVKYVVRNRTLRGLALAIAPANIGFGIILVAFPLLVFRAHGDAATVGLLLTIEGAVGIPATLLAGRFTTNGRERGIMAIAAALAAVSAAIMAAPSLAALALAVIVLGISEPVSNVALFSLRQRRTHLAWFGRAFAISMSLNFVTTPIGSAFSGPVITRSLEVSVAVAAALSFATAILMRALIPEREEVAA